MTADPSIPPAVDFAADLAPNPLVDRERDPAMIRRIAIVSAAASGAEGDRWLLDVAQGLSARGHALTVIGADENPFVGAAARSGLSIATNPFLASPPDPELLGPDPDVPRARWRLLGRFDRLRTVLAPRSLIPLWRTLDACRTQVAIVDHQESLLPLLAPRFRFRLRTVAALAPSLPLHLPVPAGAYRIRPGRWVDHLVIHSPEVAGALLAHHGTRLDMKRVSLIPLGVDTQALAAIDRRMARRCLRRDLGLSETEPLGAVVGSLASPRSVGTVVEALTRLGRAAPQMVWIGDGPLRTATTEESERRSLPLALPGFPPNLTAALAGFDLLILASGHHPLPTAPLKAMGLEIPIVAVAAGDHRSLLDGTQGTDSARGLLFPEGEASALAEAIDATLRDPGGAGRRAAAARSHVTAHHELRHVIEMWDELLTRLPSAT
jgi:glycosyltransferase involved in cell wall biosynthesis